MLAKLWKKVLFAICIIACLFNITHKLVNRHSLKENLQSVNDGETIFDLSGKDSSTSSDSFNSGSTNSTNTASNSGDNSAANGDANSDGNGTDTDSSKAKKKNTKHIVEYDDDGNVIDEYDVLVDASDNKSGNASQDDSDREENGSSRDGDSSDNNRNFDFSNAVTNAKDKIKNANVNIDVEPVEAEETYEDIPVYDENNPQRNNGENANYVYKWRDYFSIFKSDN